jgi:hypothetical protein
MTARTLLRAWNEFFFAPQSPTPIALYRILYGALNIANLLLMHGDWLTWFGPRGAVSAEVVGHVQIPPPGINPWPPFGFMSLLPHSDAAVMTFYWVFLVFAICLMIGCLSRLSSIVVYVCLVSIQARDPFIMNGGDDLLRVTGLFLIFAPTGAAMSVDRLLRIWRGREGLAVSPRSPWAQRMIQIQTAIMYIGTFWWKTLGVTWLNGTAVHYALGRTDLRNFPVPGRGNPLVIRFATWLTLVTEFSAGTLVWLRDLRYPVLIAIVALHLGIEYAMFIPLFGWISIATLVTFVYPEDLARAWSWIRRHVAPALGAPITVVYDVTSGSATRAVTVLQAVDIFGRLRVVGRRLGDAQLLPPDVSPGETAGRVLVLSSSGVRTGLEGLCALAPLIPLLWPLAPLSLLQQHSRPVAKTAAGAPRP